MDFISELQPKKCPICGELLPTDYKQSVCDECTTNFSSEQIEQLLEDLQ